VRFSALSRTDEIGRIARSIAKIQESLAELARLKAGRFASEHGDLIKNLKSVWHELKFAARNAFELLSSDGRLVSHQLKTGWSNWMQNLGVPNRP
jgi:hypothetical protein